MVGLMASVPVAANIEANCAICGAPPYPECPHEGERLELALDQAMQRWDGLQRIRHFALEHARNQIITIFHELRSARVQAHQNYLQTLPYYTLYHRYNGQPPLQAAQLQLVHSQIQQANQILQQGVDQDWRTSCMQYPTVLDYYFNLAELVLPDERHPAIQNPRFGPPPPPKGGVPRKVKERRDSVDMAVKEHRKKDRRRSRDRGRTPPPPPAPMPYR